MSWRRGQTATYWPHVLLTIAALLSHSGWAAQTWVSEGPSPLSEAGSHSAGILSSTDSNSNSNWNFDWPKPSVAPGYIIVWRSPASAYLHRCISWLTAKSRVNISHNSRGHSRYYLSVFFSHFSLYFFWLRLILFLSLSLSLSLSLLIITFFSSFILFSFYLISLSFFPIFFILFVFLSFFLFHEI